MIKEFEFEVLKFIVKAKEGKKVLDIVPESLMKEPDHMLFLHMLKSYVEEYKNIPHSVNLKQYINDVEEIEEPVKQSLYTLTGKVFGSQLSADREHLKAKITKEVQIHQTREMVAEFMDNQKDGMFDKMFKRMRLILEVGDQMFGSTDARFVLKDFTGFNHITYENVIRMPFKGMNDMMSAGGLFQPQIMVVMAPPKGFKSAIMVNIAIHCMLQGKKVFYADFENGEDDIINRCYCRMTEANYTEMTEDINIETLRDVVKFSGVRGGDIFVKSYQMYKGTPGQVQSDIEKQTADGWEPDVIIWDYADIASPTSRDDKRLARRLQIQSVYGEIKNINKQYNTVSVTASQMNRESINKMSAGMEDLAEDIGKAANADSIWAVLQSEEEQSKRVGRLQPVIQRKGVSFTGSEYVYLRLEKDKQLAEEVSFDDWQQSVDIEIEDDLEDI